MIQVENLKFFIDERNKKRASFKYGQNNYNLAAKMNPSLFYDIINGKRSYNNILTVSLAGRFFNSFSNKHEHFKLAVAVF